MTSTTPDAFRAPPPWLSSSNGFIRPYVDKESGERRFYLEATVLPAELCPQAIGILPVHLDDEHLTRNMERIEPALLDEISKLSLLPFPVYNDGLAFLLTTPDGLPPVLNRTSPLDNTTNDWALFESEKHCRDEVTCLYDLYRHYSLAMTWLNTHVNIVSTPEAKKRLVNSSKLLSWRTQQAARKFQNDVGLIPGVRALKEKLAAPNAYLTQHYSQEMAEQFEQVAFRYNVALMRCIQLFVAEIAGIDPLHMEKHQLLLTLARPPVTQINEHLQQVMERNYEQMAKLEVAVKDQEAKARLYDDEHIKAHQGVTKSGHINPSFAFQMLIHAIWEVPLPLQPPAKAV
jgi:hypothetical protein